MAFFDIHTHTTYCDGKNTPEEMVIAAIEKGMECIGFSAHSYTPFDESYCMKKGAIVAYQKEIRELKEKYKNDIKIYCGIEQDFYSDEPINDYDYVIGSVHYLKVNNEYIPIDESAQIQENAVNTYYGGDFYEFADDYFSTVSKIKNADIIGHFDIISKFNEKCKFFDEKDVRYVNSYKKALDILLEQDFTFEINTGCISRGFKTIPYPNPDIIEYIKKKGGKFILSSDAHSKEGLIFEFSKYKKYL